MWEDGVYEALPLCPDPAVVWLNQTVHCPMIQQAMQSADAIHLAAEVGRLDIVSLILAGFGMLIAILAVAAFFEIRSKAKQIATEEARIAATRAAREAARPEAARVTVEWLEQSGIDWQKLAALAPVARQSSQDFADALNDGGEENGHDSSG